MKVTQLCPTLCDPMNYTVRRILQPKILEWVLFPFSKRSSQPGIKPRSPALQADSLPAESQGKPKNTGVGSLSLLQQIWPTQESNQGLLHCRWILYQLSYEETHFVFFLTRFLKFSASSTLSFKHFFSLPTKVHLVKAMVFPVVMYGCENWIVKKAEH